MRAFDRTTLSVGLTAAATVLAAVLVGVLGAALSSGDSGLYGGDGAALVGGVALVVAAGAVTARRLRVDKLDGPALYAVVAMFTLGITALAWLGAPDTPPPGITRGDVVDALLVAAAGLVAFGIGARVAGRPASRPPFSIPRDRAPSTAALVTAYGIGLLAVLVSFATHAYGYIADPTASANLGGYVAGLNFLGTLGVLVVLAAALTYFGAGIRRLRFPLIAFVALQLVVGFYAGFKGQALQALVFVGLAYVAARGRVPWRAAALAVVATLAVIVPANAIYRTAVRNQSATPGQAAQRALNLQPSLSPRQVARSAVDYTFTRFRTIDSLAVIVADTPSMYPYAGGLKYWALPGIIAVPRALWPKKPALTDGLDFSHTYWQYPASWVTYTPLTQPGDLYRNFGLAGVLIGLLLWGVVIGLWQRLYRRFRSPRMEFVFLYSLVFLVTYVESDLPFLIATAAKTVPLVAVVAWMLLPGARSQPGYRQLFVRRQQPPGSTSETL